MKKTLITISLGLVFILAFLYFDNSSLEEFKIADNARYILIYTTGENQKEKSQINYLDKNGEEINKSLVSNVVGKNGIEYHPISNIYSLFTHDEIYFDDKKQKNIVNEEMETIYKFATEDGLDEVYTSGYLENINMVYKHIPHGLAYAREELGHFDLITLYNEQKVYNIRITESGSVTSNQETATVYNFTGEEGSNISFDKIVYEENNDSFSVTKGDIDITEFIIEEGIGRQTFFLGKTLSLDDKLYQIIHFGEGATATYLMEYSIDFKDNTIQYENNYPLDLNKGETISIDTVATINKDEIKYYSPINPNKIITFDLDKKLFHHTIFGDTGVHGGENQFHIKEIEGKIFALETDIENNSFIIYEIDTKDSFKKIIENKLPEAKQFIDMWLTDFHVINSKH